MKTVLEHDNEYACYICKKPVATEWHHIFYGPYRKWSEKYGLKVHLCNFCHRESNESVHMNKNSNLKLKRIGQQIFEQKYGNREEFIKVFGRNYL